MPIAKTEAGRSPPVVFGASGIRTPKYNTALYGQKVRANITPSRKPPNIPRSTTLPESELKYRHLIESANTIILEMDTKGRVTFINKFAENFFGFSEVEILGKSVIGTIVPPKDSSGKDLEIMIEDIGKNPGRYLHNENENMRRNGERVWIVWTNQPLYDEEGTFQGNPLYRH